MPVVERSVTIAGISTRELVAKDFVTESNEDKLRKAGHLMAQKLAGSLALVTCKEPLKGNLGSHIRHFLSECGFSDVSKFAYSSPSLKANAPVLQQMVPDPVIFLLVQDNIELACQAIEKAAMDRAVIDVDDSFAAAYETRRRHREVRLACVACALFCGVDSGIQQRPNQPFWDSSVAQSNVSSSLPDPLRIKPSGVQPGQIAVYEDFSKFSCRCARYASNNTAPYQAWTSNAACSPVAPIQLYHTPATTKSPPCTALLPPPSTPLKLSCAHKRLWTAST